MLDLVWYIIFMLAVFFYLTNVLPLIQKNNAYVFEVVGEEKLTGDVEIFFWFFWYVSIKP